MCPPRRLAMNFPDEEQVEALHCEGSLRYVAVSRTRNELVVNWSGKRSGLLAAVD